MSEFVVDSFPHPCVPVTGGGLFPVRRIFCVGKNYTDHVREMGGDVTRDPPVFFTKPADAIVTDSAPVAYPPGTQDLHYEGELVVALQSGGLFIKTGDVARCIFGYAAGCDLTRRDLQHAAKMAGNPWDCAKAFDHSAPIGHIIRAEQVTLDGATLTLAVNGETRQNAPLATMIWSVPEIIAALSMLFELRAGDLIYTGTPAGVGPLSVSDRVALTITDMPRLDFVVTERRGIT